MPESRTALRLHPATLRAIPMFASLPEAELERLVSAATARHVGRGTVIVRAGDPIDVLYILVSGRAKVLSSDAEGREVIFTILGAGEFFGEMGLIDGEPRSADVVALEACELVVISREAFRRCIFDNFEVTLQIMKSLVRRLREADRKIESLALMDVYGRVAKLLLEASEESGGRRVVKRRLTKQDIAKMVGASREMVSRVMKDLEHSGHIVVADGQIVIQSG